MMPKFYAVREGRVPGVYYSWNDCLIQVRDHHGAIYKSFPTLTEAEAFVTSKNPLRAAGSKKFYAVKRGHTPGIYTDWPTAKKQIDGATRPRFKGFATRGEAEKFMDEEELMNTQNGASGPGRGGTDESSGKRRKSETQEPPKKKRRSETVDVTDSETFNPHLKLPPADAEDGFDYTMKMDKATGKLRVKTAAEIDALKIAPLSKSKKGEWVKVWTDGACRANGKANAVAGVGVYFGPQDPRNVAARLGGRQTNQRAELTALKRALDIIPMNSHALVYSDSQYAIKCVTEWFQNWEARGWVTSSKKSVENREVIEEVISRIREREKNGGKTRFEWVKGHGGDVGNEAADKLAVTGTTYPIPTSDEE